MPKLTTELVLKLRDELSPSAKKASAGLEAIKKAEISLQLQSEKLSKATKALADFQALDRQLQSTTAKFRQQQQSIKDLGQQILSVEGPTKRLEASFKSADAVLQQIAKTMARQKKALAETGRSFEQLAGNPLRSVVSAEDTMRRRIEETTRAIDVQAKASQKLVESHEASARRFQRVKNIFSGVGMLAGPIILHGTGEAVRAGASVQRERVRLGQLRNAVSPAQAEEVERQSLDLSAKYRLPQADLMHTTRNAITILGDVEEALKLSEPLAKLRVIASARGGSESVEEDFDKLIKGLEIKGVTQDPVKFQAYMEGIAKGLNAFGDTLKPYQYYEMFKYGRQATPMLSERFMLGTAPALGQELGGSSFGNAVSGFNMAIVGGVMKPKAAQEMYELGLVDEENLIRTKTGLITGVKSQGVHGWETAQRDPYAWVKEFLSPALTAAGHTSKADVMSMVPSLFSNRVVAQMMGILLTQQPRIDKDMKIQAGAGGLDSANEYLSKDPFMALKGLSTSLETFGGVLTSPIMEPAARALDMLSSGIGKLSVAYDDLAKEHPDLAKTIGGGVLAGGLYQGGKLTYGLFDKVFGDSGLKGAAAAQLEAGASLQVAATQLEVAAARLGGSAAGGAAAGAAGAGAASEVGGAAAAVAAGAAASRGILGSGGIRGVAGAMKKGLVAGVLEQAGEWAIDKALDQLPHPKYPDGYDPKWLHDRGITGDVKSLFESVPALFERKVIAPLTGPAADAADRMKERNDLINSESQKLKDSVWQFGQLDDSALRLKASFEGLSTSVAGLGGGLSGSGGLINASLETGGDIRGLAGGGSAGAGDAVGIAERLLGANGAQAAAMLHSKMTPGEWCADFVNGVVKGAGGKGVNSSMASAFSTWGKAVALNDAKRGDVILERHGNQIGHVGMATGRVIRDALGNVRAVEMISGNYGHMVKKNWEPTGIIGGLRRGNPEDAMPRRAPPRGASIEAQNRAYSPTINIHVAGGADLDHNKLGDRIAAALHRHYEDSLRASYADTGFG